MITTKYLLESNQLRQRESVHEHNTKSRNSLPSNKLRIGAVSYLNSKPLIRGLELGNMHTGFTSQYELIVDYPSLLAAGLRTGKYDLALVPSIEYLIGKQSGLEYQIISDACVAARGPVLSVKVYFRVHPGEVKKMLLDAGSRTSAMLAKVMLAERYGVYPECQELPLDKSPWSQQVDAMLVIGDRAMQSHDEEYAYVWDLGEEWLNWTGYPFVFAMWVSRGEFNDQESLIKTLESSRDLGVTSIPEIVEEEAQKLGISQQLGVQYLSQHLHFNMQSAERRGLELYFELANQYLNTQHREARRC